MACARHVSCADQDAKTFSLHSSQSTTLSHSLSLSSLVTYSASLSFSLQLRSSSSLMAGVLETLTVPRASVFPAAALAPMGSYSVYALSGSRKSVKLPEIRGLKICYSSTSRSFSSSSSSSLRLDRRVGRIVCEAQKTAVEVTSVTDASWQSLVLESDSAVLVEFWAPWCGPCRMIHPIIDELAKQYTGKLKCYKVNTDESPSIATRYGIRSIPTVIIFKNGEKKDAVIGAVPKSTLTSSIEKFL